MLHINVTKLKEIKAVNLHLVLNMQSDGFFARNVHAAKSNMGPSTKLNATDKVDSRGQNTGTPAMPKMGVRARVSEWPPKKDCTSEWCKSVVSLSSHDQNNQMDINKSFDMEFSESKYITGDIVYNSSSKGLYPIRQRSNSDVTISDIDTDDILDQNTHNPNTGASLHREYGSTSSIDRQGLSGDNVFPMIKGNRGESMEHKNLTPFTFSEVFHCDPTMYSSFHAAEQMNQVVSFSGFDYMDSALLIRRKRDKLFKRHLKTDAVEPLLFRKLRTVKIDDALKFSFEPEDGRFEKSKHLWTCEKCFAHYDVQSILFDINKVIATPANIAKLKNITTGASAASQSSVAGGDLRGCEFPLEYKEELYSKDSHETDEGDGKSNDIILNCPYFRNEIGGESDRKIAISRANSLAMPEGKNWSFESSLNSHCTNASVSVLEVPRENQPIQREKVKRYIIEHIDLGAYYYRKLFYGKEHQNYFGIDDNLGPIAVSIRREKTEDIKKKEISLFNYRIAFRTSELTTLRGAVLEDAVPSTARHGSARGLPHKEILEYVVPELNVQCLRQSINSTKVQEQLLKLDEQALSFQHKVGILYCKADQSTEEEMYNNEATGPAFEEFLDLLGQRVRLKGFNKYRAQLDNKTDSTGTHSIYTTYKDYELMFHVSTMLPYMPNNRQQLLRKRHIGNDIVTIVFQEPGALAFTPRTIRSHFQHAFIIVRVHNPCTESVCYSVAVSRSKDVPSFGPPIPKGATFPKSAVFRDFLLAKVINAENATHKSEKFRAMATRTRQEYLKDLAENFVSTATVDSLVKFSFINFGAKKKERVKPKKDAHFYSIGAIVWNAIARDFGLSSDIECLLGISNEFVILVEKDSKNVVFNCSCRDVIGWTSGLMTMKMFYERGECILVSSVDNCAEDIREIVQRLEIVTKGCETKEIILRRNNLGQLGFHVNFEGIVAEVEPFGLAWKAGLRQGSRLVEICKVAVVTLTHEQMIDLLRNSVTVKAVIIQPYEDGSPRRGCTELCCKPMVEYKVDRDGTPCEYKTPFRCSTTWHQIQTPIESSHSHGSPILEGEDNFRMDRLQCQQFLLKSQSAIPRSTSLDRKMPDGARCPSQLLHENQMSTPMECDLIKDCEEELEDIKYSEQLHMLSNKKHSSYKGRSLQKENNAKISPNKNSYVKSCSSHSTSTIASSSASSNSNEKHFGSGDLMDPELLGLTYIKGASTDSGFDTAPCSISTHAIATTLQSNSRSVSHNRTEQMMQWNNPSEEIPDNSPKNIYSVHIYPTNETAVGSMGDLIELSSHSSGSCHPGSPSLQCLKSNGALDACTEYMVPPTITQQKSMTVSKSLLRQGAVNKYTTEWEKTEDSPPPEVCDLEECQSEEVLPLSNSLLSASMEADSERLHVLSKDVGDGREKFSVFGMLSPRQSLYRTLSDESISSNRRGSSYASSHSSIFDPVLSNDILFSTTPQYNSLLSTRTYLNPGLGNLRNDWFSDGSLSKCIELGLLSAPESAALLDRSQLVNSARAFKDQCVESFCDMQCEDGFKGLQEISLSSNSVNGKDFGESTEQCSPSTLTGKVNQLEVILRKLQTDLLKEKEDKAMLQAEVHHLRQYNIRLQEESQTASAQLRKFREWFLSSVDKKT